MLTCLLWSSLPRVILVSNPVKSDSIARLKSGALHDGCSSRSLIVTIQGGGVLDLQIDIVLKVQSSDVNDLYSPSPALF